MENQIQQTAKLNDIFTKMWTIWQSEALGDINEDMEVWFAIMNYNGARFKTIDELGDMNMVDAPTLADQTILSGKAFGLRHNDDDVINFEESFKEDINSVAIFKSLEKFITVCSIYIILI